MCEDGGISRCWPMFMPPPSSPVSVSVKGSRTSPTEGYCTNIVAPAPYFNNHPYSSPDSKGAGWRFGEESPDSPGRFSSSPIRQEETHLEDQHMVRNEPVGSPAQAATPHRAERRNSEGVNAGLSLGGSTVVGRMARTGRSHSKALSTQDNALPSTVSTALSSFNIYKPVGFTTSDISLCASGHDRAAPPRSAVVVSTAASRRSAPPLDEITMQRPQSAVVSESSWGSAEMARQPPRALSGSFDHRLVKRGHRTAPKQDSISGGTQCVQSLSSPIKSGIAPSTTNSTRGAVVLSTEGGGGGGVMGKETVEFCPDQNMFVRRVDVNRLGYGSTQEEGFREKDTVTFAQREGRSHHSTRPTEDFVVSKGDSRGFSAHGISKGRREEAGGAIGGGDLGCKHETKVFTHADSALEKLGQSHKQSFGREVDLRSKPQQPNGGQSEGARMRRGSTRDLGHPEGHQAYRHRCSSSASTIVLRTDDEQPIEVEPQQEPHEIRRPSSVMLGGYTGSARPPAKPEKGVMGRLKTTSLSVLSRLGLVTPPNPDTVSQAEPADSHHSSPHVRSDTTPRPPLLESRESVEEDAVLPAYEMLKHIADGIAAAEEEGEDAAGRALLNFVQDDGLHVTLKIAATSGQQVKVAELAMALLLQALQDKEARRHVVETTEGEIVKEVWALMEHHKSGSSNDVFCGGVQALTAVMSDSRMVPSAVSHLSHSCVGAVRRWQARSAETKAQSQAASDFLLLASDHRLAGGA